MQKITPFLWFATQAEEAVNFYTSTFKNSKITSITHFNADVPGPKGKVMTLTFELEGQEFIALNGGPGVFEFTPAVSFFVSCATEKEINGLWEKLSDGGTVLMPIQDYPFSDRFGWLNDRYGVSWQLNLGRRDQPIAPFLMFVGEQHGKAGDAIHDYTALFDHSEVMSLVRYGKDEVETEGTIKHAVFSLSGQEFMALDSNLPHPFTFTGAISFFVHCQTQAEVDRYWNTLTEGGDEAAQQCGWLSDRYGVYWQIVPVILGELLADPDPEKSGRVTQAMLQMKKIDIDGLKRAYEGQQVSGTNKK